MFLRTPVHDSRPKEMSLVVIGTITVMDRKRALHELMNIDIIRIHKTDSTSDANFYGIIQCVCVCVVEMRA